jgi:hypothetical protein
MKALVLIAVAACGSGPRFLGERLPSGCHTSYSDCNAELDISSWRDGFVVDDRPLVAYLERVTARVVHASTLPYMPHVILMPVGSAEVLGRNIVVGREMLARLGSEAQLAGIIAHETAHLEAKNNETSYVGEPVDEESLADERAVVLLVRAGYPANGMALALARLEDTNDPYHPPMKQRIQRTQLLAQLTPPPPAADERRGEFLRALDGLAIAVHERGLRGDAAWIVVDRGVAVPIPAGVDVDDGDDSLRAWHGRVRYGAWRLGARAGDEAIEAMRDAEQRPTPVGIAIMGAGLPDRDPPDGSLAQLLESKHVRAGKVDSDEIGAVLRGPDGGAMLLTVKGPNNAALLRTWLTTLRAPTDAERARTISPRIRLVRAPRTAPVRDLVASCVDPKRARDLDDPDRVIRAGEPFKCTDR